MSLTRYRPCDELVHVLAPAFEPCTQFTNACARFARWQPGDGHVPRGFIGALGELDEVEAVLVIAEPADPKPGESHVVVESDPVATIEGICRFVYDCFEHRVSPFHRFVREVLDLAYPRTQLAEQLRRIWITESVLCSAEHATASVARASEDACVRNYLAPQLALLPGRVVIPFGEKARKRSERHGLARQEGKFHAFGLPYANRPEASASREAAAAMIRAAHHGRVDR
jgi:hypothetical protein